MNLSVLLRTADGYLSAGKALFNTRKNAVMFFEKYISPFAVNTVFACELYLKYIYAKENNKTGKKTHKLLDLFNKLSSERKEAVKNAYQKWTSLESFDDCIQTHNQTFEEFRYMYEKNNIKVEPQSLYNLAVALHNVCYSMEDTDNAD